MVRSTLKTLAYDCGNPVQYVCGRSPAVLFYLLDRHALLAMTMGSKYVFLNSLTTPGCAHPSNGGELDTYRRGIKFPSTEGWRALRDGVVTIIENNIPERYHTRMPTATTGPRANIVCVGGSVGGGCRAKHDGGWGYIIPRACAANTCPLFHGTRLFKFICAGGVCIGHPNRRIHNT